MELIAKVFALFALIVGLVVMVFAFSAVGAVITLAAVNYLVSPAILVLLFGITKLTFLKAFALNVVVGWLFGSKSVSSK